MKTLTTLFLLLTITPVWSQLNNIKNNEIRNNISFNDVTLQTIFNAKGDFNTLNVLFGNNMIEKEDNSAVHKAKFIYNDSISFSFEDESNTGDNFFITKISIDDPKIVVRIRDYYIKLGDSKNKLSSFEYNTRYGGYVFVDEDTGSISLAFKIDKATNTISEITYTNF